MRWEWYPDTEQRPGLIKIKNIKANLTRETETKRKMDPLSEI